MVLPPIQDTSRIAVVASQLLGVLIVIATVVTQQGELHSPRPLGNKTQVGAKADENGNRFARPWEDPLEDLPTFVPVSSQPSSTPQLSEKTNPRPPDVAPSTTSRPSETTSLPVPDVATKKAGPVEQNQAKPIQVAPHSSVSAAPSPGYVSPTSSPSPPNVNYIFLWNILDARPIPDEIERRLRIRYAVVSAVEAVGYLPYRESVLVPINLENEKDAKNGATKIGYFETFQAIGEAAFQRVCLIWTPKLFELEPEIIKKVTEQIGKLDGATAQATVHILHYGTSDDLDYYLQKHKDFGSEISFMLATMPIPSPSPAPPPSLRPIVTDDVLVERLAAELKLRIPALNCENKTSQTSPAHRHFHGVRYEI